MASSNRRAAVAVLGVLGLACADYSKVADLHRENQEFLYAYEVKLCFSDAAKTRRFVQQGVELDWEAREKRLKDELAARKNRGEGCKPPSELKDDARLMNRAERELIYAKARLDARDLPDAIRQTLLAAETERIQREYAQQLGVRGKALEALHGKLIEGIRALRKNGHEVQEYLELPWWKRLFAEAKGADEEKLRAIGKDLEGLTDRLEATTGSGG